MTNISTEYNPVPILEVSFGDKRCPVGTSFLPLLGNFTRIAFIGFRNLLLHYVSILFLKYPSIPALFPHHSLHQPHLSSSPDPLFLVPTTLQSACKINSNPFSQEIHRPTFKSFILLLTSLGLPIAD